MKKGKGKAGKERRSVSPEGVQWACLECEELELGNDRG